MTRPREAHLRHDNLDPEGFAQAMAACQGWAPSCSDSGCCLHNGDCFNQSGHERAARAIEEVTSGMTDIATRRALERAAIWLRNEAAEGGHAHV